MRDEQTAGMEPGCRSSVTWDFHASLVFARRDEHWYYEPIAF